MKQRVALFILVWAAAACSESGASAPTGSGGGGGVTPGAGGAAAAGTAGTTTAAGHSGVAGAPGGAAGAAGTFAKSCEGGGTFSYLVRSLATFEHADGGELFLHGFDLDGRASNGSAPEDCGVGDHMAADGRTGIDNTIGGFWGEDLSQLFNPSYARGNSPFVIRLSGVDDLANDDCVDVEWSGATWAGAPADPASPQAAGKELRQDGAIARLHGARIDAGRLLANGEAAITLRAFLEGTGGVRGFVFPLALSRISFTTGADQLTQGELGGRVEPETVYQAYQTAYGSLIDRGAVASILFPDLPSGPTTCALLSAGFGFEAVRVTILP